MAFSSSKTRIILMSENIMSLYNMFSPEQDLEYQPVTFYKPQECLDMLVEPEADEAPEELESKSYRIEKQLGELELRLSFFSDNFKWE